MILIKLLIIHSGSSVEIWNSLV